MPYSPPVLLDSTDCTSILPLSKGGTGAGLHADPPGVAMKEVPGGPIILTVQPPGACIGFCQNDATQGTSSATPVALATDDVVSFDLRLAGNVLIEYTANAYTNYLGLYAHDVLEVDGVPQPPVDTGFPQPGSPPNVVIRRVLPLIPGPHTVRVKHAVLPAGTAYWRNRLLTVKVY